MKKLTIQILADEAMMADIEMHMNLKILQKQIEAIEGNEELKKEMKDVMKEAFWQSTRLSKAAHTIYLMEEEISHVQPETKKGHGRSGAKADSSLRTHRKV